jgi:integrase
VLLAAIDVDEDGIVRDPRFGIAVRLALFAGLRAGEVVTRQWKDVDWQGGLLTVGPKTGKGWSWRTKNGKTRLVPMSTDLRAALRAWWVRSGQPDGEGWLVPTTEGERRKDLSWLNEALHRVCAGPRPRKGRKRVPVLDPPVTFHGLRHSFASLALEAGVPLLEVSRILGHHSPEFTARQYAHVAERRLVAGAERLGEYLRARAGG